MGDVWVGVVYGRVFLWLRGKMRMWESGVAKSWEVARLVARCGILPRNLIKTCMCVCLFVCSSASALQVTIQELSSPNFTHDYRHEYG